MSESLVLVGRKTLFAAAIKRDDPIKFGEVLNLDGDALEIAKGKTYDDGAGNTWPMFVPAESVTGQRAIAKSQGVKFVEPETPAANKRTRRRAAS